MDKKHLYSYISPEQIELQALDDLKKYASIRKEKTFFPVEPEEIAEILYGVEVVPAPEIFTTSGEFEELALYSAKDNCIFLNTSPSNRGGRLTFSIAHELGHVSLHKHLILDAEKEDKTIHSYLGDVATNGVEWQAEYYAGALLMPAHEVETVLNGLVNQSKVLFLDEYESFLKDHFDVSRHALEVRLSQIGYNIADKRYEQKRTKEKTIKAMDLLEEERIHWTMDP